MPKRLIYLPLERYRERYTEWSSGQDGAMETDLINLQIPFMSIRPSNEVFRIKEGVVLDVQQRARWGFEQTEELIEHIMSGEITKEDVIYIEDFWHPGMEMIPYALSTKFGPMGQWPKMYAYCYAQSWDPHDFTAPWTNWIRPFEVAWGNTLTGIFLSCPEHRKLLCSGYPNSTVYWDKVHAVGLPYNSDVVQRYSSFLGIEDRRQPRVVWSSRWDKEKNPDFFCKLASLVIRSGSNITFEVCTGSEELRSNDKSLLRLAHSMKEKFPNHFRIHKGLSKSVYYDILRTSIVQFNAASQDWVSNTLLEATTFGCLPLYPNYLSFPAALNFRDEFMYKPGNLKDAKDKLDRLFESYFHDQYRDVSFVYKKYNDTFKRALKVMGFRVGRVTPLVFENN